MPAAAVARPVGGEIIPQKARSAPALQGHVPPTAAPPPPPGLFSSEPWRQYTLYPGPAHVVVSHSQ